MFKTLSLAIFVGLIFLGCQSKPEKDSPTINPTQTSQAESTPIDQEWKPSTLSDATIAKANDAVKEYNKCLTAQTKAKASETGDPRNITNMILKNCESMLPAIKTAFDAEKVPAVISERYMRKTRSHGTQAVLRTVMGVHAERSGNEAEAAAKGAKN